MVPGAAGGARQRDRGGALRAAGGASGPCDSALLESLLRFRAEAERALEEVERAATRSVAGFEACLTYLGEPVGNMKEQPEAFFTTISDFLRNLRKIESDGTALPTLPPRHECA